MIPCFENLVGIRSDCGEQVASLSGLYVQDLAFINMKLVNSMITDESSGIELLNTLYNNAVNYLLNDVRTRMIPYFKYNSTLETNVVGFYPYQRTLKSSMNGFYKGIQLQIRQWPYLDIFIPSLTLFVNYTGTINIKVWNLTTGELLDTVPVEVEAGVQKVVPYFYKKYSTNGQFLNLFIGYDSTGITSYQSTVYNTTIPTSLGNCRTCFNTPFYQFGSTYVWIYSKAIDINAAPVQINLQSINDCGGLSITYTLSCSLDKWICTNRDVYAFGLLHRWGMEILREAMLSTRLNTLIILKKEEKENLYSYFEQEYKKAMEDIFRNFRMPKDICFHCNTHIQTNALIP